MKRILALIAGLLLVPSAAAAQTTDALLDSLQYGAFRYAWDQASPANGLIKDRSTPGSPASIAAQGFGFSAICIGVDHGWVPRATAAARVRTALRTFWLMPQGSAPSGIIGYQGLYYHFLDMSTAVRTWDCELSTIDTALLLAGILDAREYFQGADDTETEIRALADSIYRRVDWTFMQNSNGWGIRMGWKPGTGFSGYGDWVGYNEAMILYILAMGSPTHPLANPDLAWSRWTSGYNWGTQYGQTYLIFPPLFGHQYSHCWIDFRNIYDEYMQGRGIDYFENSRRATLAQQAYCIANPFGRVGYSATLWGLTASDDPVSGYLAHGAPPAQNDNGTLTPTAPISSIPFAPEIVIPTIENLWNNYKTPLWGPYGFKDAFNLTANPDWYGPDVLGIDQGPIAIMIENYRTEAVWQRVMRTPEILTGLFRAGFTGTPLAVPVGSTGHAGIELSAAAPNPFHDTTTLAYRLAAATRVRLSVFDVTGREVARLVDEAQGPGAYQVALRAHGLPSGIYLCQLEAQGRAAVRTIALVR